MVGDGIVTFGVWPLLPDKSTWLFRNSKSARWMLVWCPTLPTTRITGGARSSLPSGLMMVTGMPVFTPPSLSRKSMWK